MAKPMARSSTLRALDPEDVLGLVSAHDPLFRALARRLRVRKDDLEDAMQGARLGFLIALSRFDPKRGATVGVFARGFIVKEILLATFRTHSRGKALLVPVPSGFITGDTSCFEEEVLDRIAPMSDVHRFLEDLPPVQREVAIAIGCEGVKQTDVARDRGVSEAAVSQMWSRIRARAREQLRTWVA